MANKTIYGCLDKTTKQITFVGEACDSSDYTGCLITSGLHAGQIEVVIDDGSCDDTYYGCVNWSTGKFQLIIPDDCCVVDCGYCSGITTPYSLTVTITGVTYSRPCGESGAHGSERSELNTSVNGIFTLDQVEGSGCHWRYSFGDIITNYYYPSELDCTGDVEITYTDVWLSVIKSGTNNVNVYLGISMGFCMGLSCIFVSTGNTPDIGKCVEGTYGSADVVEN